MIEFEINSEISSDQSSENEGENIFDFEDSTKCSYENESSENEENDDIISFILFPGKNKELFDILSKSMTI